MSSKQRRAIGMFSMRRVAAALVASAVVVGTLSACAVEGSTTPAEDGAIHKLVWAANSPPDSLDTARAFATGNLVSTTPALEGLLGYGPDGQLEGVLASEWSQVDPMTWTFTIREGVSFWDGTPLTTDDVVYSIDRHLDPENPSQLGTFFASVDSVEKSGESQLTIRLSQPDPQVLSGLALAWIMPRASSEALGDDLGTASADGVNIVGTGPYRITSFTGAEGMTFEKNEHYWGDAPEPELLEVKYIADKKTQMLALQSGEIDGVFGVPADQGSIWDSQSGIRTEYAPGLRTQYLSFDMDQDPWRDPLVRRAVAHAIDRDSLISAFFNGKAELATSVTPPASWLSVIPEAQVPGIYSQFVDRPYDVDLAKQLIAQSDFPDGFTASIDYASDEQVTGKVLVSIAEMLKEIGVTLEVKEVDPSAWLSRIFAHEDLGLEAITIGSNADPAYIPAFILPSAMAAPNALNTANYHEETVDRLMAEQSVETVPEARADLIAEALMIASEDLPYLPLWWEDDSVATRAKYSFDGFFALSFARNWAAAVQPTG